MQQRDPAVSSFFDCFLLRPGCRDVPAQGLTPPLHPRKGFHPLTRFRWRVPVELRLLAYAEVAEHPVQQPLLHLVAGDFPQGGLGGKKVDGSHVHQISLRGLPQMRRRTAGGLQVSGLGEGQGVRYGSLSSQERPQGLQGGGIMGGQGLHRRTGQQRGGILRRQAGGQVGLVQLERGVVSPQVT